MRLAHPLSQPFFTTLDSERAAEHEPETVERAPLPETKAAGISALWLVFYVVIGVAAVLRGLLH